MSIPLLIPLLICILAVALLYSSVGHGGASGYIATLALFSISPVAFKPTALVLNILVAGIASYSYARAGHFSGRLFWPFAATSIPLSFIGGFLSLPSHLFKAMVGIILLFAAVRLVFHAENDFDAIRSPSTPVAMIIGAMLGFLSGLTGVGGGIFLSPLLLLLKWGKAREVSAVSALFILANSIAGLLGHISSLKAIPPFVPLLAIAAILGGTVGSFFGSRHLPVAAVMKSLALVLTIAGIKLLLI